MKGKEATLVDAANSLDDLRRLAQDGQALVKAGDWPERWGGQCVSLPDRVGNVRTEKMKPDIGGMPGLVITTQ